MAEVIGIISGLLGIYSFYGSLFGGSSAYTSVVRVAAGLNGNGLSGADGSLSSIRLYNYNQEILANVGGGSVGSGGFKDFPISQINNQQAVYVQLYASNDAICIPAVTITWVDGHHYGWVGDFGYQCGLNWYYSHYYVDDSPNQPMCTWIDGDKTNNIKAQMIMINMPAFSGDKKQGSPGDYCGYPELRAYTNTGASIFKRDEIEGPPKRVLDSRLVISSSPNHNATKLCASYTSRGPDLVSLYEGVYCDMETSETLPLCTKDITENCFHVDTKKKVKRDSSATREYTDVLTWD